MATRFGQNRAAGPGAAVAPKGRFKGVDLNLGQGKRLLPLGTHVIEVIETRRNVSIKGDTFFADVKIIESDTEGVKPGAEYTWLRSMNDTYGYGTAAVCRFAIACGNLDDKEIEELLAEVDTGTSVVDAACGVAVEKYGENPLKGCKVQVVASQGFDRKTGAPTKYPDCEFSPVE